MILNYLTTHNLINDSIHYYANTVKSFSNKNFVKSFGNKVIAK